jgi:hypothetical protein
VQLFFAFVDGVKQCNTYPVGLRGSSDTEYEVVAISATGIAVGGKCEASGVCGSADLPNPVIEYY